MTIDMGLQPEI